MSTVSSFHNLPHHNQALTNTKIKRLLDMFKTADEKVAVYALFWIVMELIHQNKNRLTTNDENLEQIINEYCGFFVTPEMIKLTIGNFVDLEIIKKESDENGEYYFSPYQRLVKTTKGKHFENLQSKNLKLQNIISEQEKLIKRLNDKIEFMKSDKKQIKDNVVRTKF